jgi:hypothetical protein
MEDRLLILEEKVASSFNKKIPAAIIAAVLLQTGGAIWWASNISNTVSNNVSELVVKNYISDYAAIDNDRHFLLAERVTKMESTHEYIIKALDRIEVLLHERNNER